VSFLAPSIFSPKSSILSTSFGVGLAGFFTSFLLSSRNSTTFLGSAFGLTSCFGSTSLDFSGSFSKNSTIFLDSVSESTSYFT
jgi:hypothetical protein